MRVPKKRASWEYNHAERQKVGLKIKHLRQLRKLSHTRLSELALLSRQQILKLEKGDSDSPIGTYMRLAHALQVPLAELLEPLEDMRPGRDPVLTELMAEKMATKLAAQLRLVLVGQP